MKTQLTAYFGYAAHNVNGAIGNLEDLIWHYKRAGLDPKIVQARIAAIEGKIALLKSIKLDPEAHPWSEDM